VTQRLAAALQTVAHDPSVVAAFAKLGIDSAGTTQEQALDSIHKDMPVYARIIDMAGLPKVRR
jgi:tripartite-type tricarboxylate transporter receptor subunit TctC